MKCIYNLRIFLLIFTPAKLNSLMVTLYTKLNFSILILYLISGQFTFIHDASAMSDSCVITGPTVVTTSQVIAYVTSLSNVNWEMYSYDGSQAQLVNSNLDTLILNTGPTLGKYTVYTLSDPQKEVLCSLNVNVEAALPVEISSFTSGVSGRNLTLNWTTLMEQNNSGFQIERSVVNDIWYSLGFVKGGGTINSPVSYSYEDKNLSSGRYKYRLKQIDLNGSYRNFELPDYVIIGIPEKYALHQNYPNPFNPSTQINYDIAVSGNVKITVYDISGKVISTLVNGFKPAGFHTVNFDGDDLAGGIYFCKMESGNFILVRKMMLLK